VGRLHNSATLLSLGGSRVLDGAVRSLIALVTFLLSLTVLLDLTASIGPCQPFYPLFCRFSSNVFYVCLFLEFADNCCQFYLLFLKVSHRYSFVVFSAFFEFCAFCYFLADTSVVASTRTYKYEYKYEYLGCKYKYKYCETVLEYYSSTSTSTKYYITGPTLFCLTGSFLEMFLRRSQALDDQTEPITNNVFSNAITMVISPLDVF